MNSIAHSEIIKAENLEILKIKIQSFLFIYFIIYYFFSDIMESIAYKFSKQLLLSPPPPPPPPHSLPNIQEHPIPKKKKNTHTHTETGSKWIHPDS